MAIPWLRPQDKRSLQGMDAQQEQFPTNDSYYGDRRELAGYGGSQQNDAMRADPIAASNNYGAAPSQFAQDQMRRVEAARGQQSGASWDTASPVQPAQQQGGPSQFAQDQTQRIGAEVAKGGGWGWGAAPSPAGQPMQQASYATAQPAPQNRVNPMIENSRTAVMNNAAPAPAQQAQQFAARSQFAQDQRSRTDGQQKATWGAAPAAAAPARQWDNRPGQRWDSPKGGIVGTSQPQRGWGNRPAERQPTWGRSQQQPTSQGNTASPAQPAQRDAAAYGQPKKWGA